MELENIGKKVLEKDIEAFENKYGATIPKEYQEFLFKTNGGDPTEFICKPEFEETDEDGEVFMQSINIDHFFSLDEVESKRS